MALVLKRMMDIAFAGIGILLLFPVFIVLVLLVYIQLGTPVFFMQDRPGKDEKIFRMVKFRTMNNLKDSSGKMLPDIERITNFGRFMRRSSLDELPGLFNVLKGDMSLVGPRPLLVKYLPFYSERERIRHKMRPGITGLAQVNGRNNVSWDKRLDFDVKYVENFSILLDMKILYQTISQVIKQKDALEVSSLTMPDFDEYRSKQAL